MPDYNIIIPVVYKDYDFLRKTIKYVCRCLAPKKIFIITDSKMARFLPREVKSHPLCAVLDENSLLEGLSFQTIRDIVFAQGREHTNTGWFFQQFLKLGFALSPHCDTEYYLSWDADTLPLQPLCFFDEEGHPCFTMKSEYNPPYFVVTKRLLGLDKTNPSSYIAEHMMFRRDIVKQMLEDISGADGVAGNTWFEKIMNAIVPETVSTSSFSEFETYGTYCMVHHPTLYRERQMPSYRLAGLIQGRFVSDKILKRISTDAHTASFEIYERPPFPWGKICEWYEKYLQKKAKLLKWWVS